MVPVPDAPWIRETEQYGMPENNIVVKCDVCGCECEELVFDRFDNVIGCDQCVHYRDAFEWYMELHG